MRITLPPRLDRDALARLSRLIGHATSPILFVGSCAGLDLGAELDDDQTWNGLRTLFRGMFTAPPTAAFADGPVEGGGVGLMCACDVVLATPAATFALPDLLFGLIPGAVLPSVRSRIGARGLRDLAMRATALGAEEARRLGLVDRVATDEGRILDHLGRLDPEAVRALRRLLQPDYLAALDAGIAASRRRVSGASPRLARWALGQIPWTE